MLRRTASTTFASTLLGEAASFLVLLPSRREKYRLVLEADPSMRTETAD